MELKDLEYYRTLRTPTVVEKADALLLCMASESPLPGSALTNFWNVSERLVSSLRNTPSSANVEWENFRYLSFACAANPAELYWLIHNFLKGELLLQGNSESNFHITPKGWQRIEQLRSGGVESRTGFVAMNFDKGFDVLFDEVLRPGIEAAGYDAHRVDKKDSNEKIDDEMIAGIRACRFMVADASRHRPNVYYEAGYAKGLGRDVIWMVEKRDVEKLHFDTRQYPFIPWTRDDLPAARKALQMRIEATIGRGPVTR